MKNKPAVVPMSPGIIIKPPTEEEITEAKFLPFRELIGCLLYLAVVTRPDIIFAVSKFALENGTEYVPLCVRDEGN